MEKLEKFYLWSFNPCFIGTYSITKQITQSKRIASQSFNPCFIGTYSITDYNFPCTLEEYKF